MPHWDLASQLGLRFHLPGNRAMAELNRALAGNTRTTKERLAMNDDALETIIGKARRLQELRRANERVRQLERKLRGEPIRPEDSTYIPEFLRLQASSDPAGQSSVRERPDAHPSNTVISQCRVLSVYPISVTSSRRLNVSTR